MHIKHKTRQHRRDFTAVYACAHCEHEQRGSGYDDAYFHEHVIPQMSCKACHRTGGGPASTPDVLAHVTL